MTYSYKLADGEMRYIDTGGDRTPMVFIHGLPTSKELFLPLVEAFRSEYRCIAVDLLDYGESDQPGRHIEHKERAENLRSLFHALKLNDIVLVCHDLGSSIAMDLLAISSETVARLVVMSPPVYPDFREPTVVRIVRSRVLGPILIAAAKNSLLSSAVRKGLVNASGYDRYLREALERSYRGREGSRALLRNLRWGTPAGVFAEYPDIIRGISCPTLIIQGRSDPYIPVSHARRMAEDIPDSCLALLPEAGHFLPIDVPEAVEETIRSFLEGT